MAIRVRRENPCLPPEIIIDILKRIPVKSLFRFQSVCKDWKNLFKTPYFIAQHNDHSAKKNPLLISHAFIGNTRYSSLCLLHYKTESVEIEKLLTMYSLRRSCGIIGSCNGLLCVILNYNNDASLPSLLMLNPATREIRQIPGTTINDWGIEVFGWGFGFSPVVRDYKIVRIHTAMMYYSIGEISSDNNFWVHGVEVYSLRTGSWKEVEFGLIRHVRLQSKSITTNRTMFWLGLDCEDKDHCHRIILSFDLATEVFKLIPRPSSTFVPHTYANVLDVYENKLALLHGYYADMNSFIDLWALEEGSDADGKSWCWTKKYTIGPTSCLLFPICIWRNEIVCQNIESARKNNNTFEDDDSTSYLFNLTINNELKKFHIFTPLNHLDGIFNYAESLVSMSD